MKVRLISILLLLISDQKCLGHYLDDYYAVGSYLPEMWLEFPLMAYLNRLVHVPPEPTRGTKPAEYGYSGTKPSVAASLDGIHCNVNEQNYRHWFQYFSYENLQSFTITMQVKQTEGIGPIWSSVNGNNSARHSTCYIAHGYEEGDDRLSEALGKNRIHARCDQSLTRALVVENCPIDQGVQLALIYDHENNYMRLYCDDHYDQVSTTPGVAPILGVTSQTPCAIHYFPKE